MTFARKIRTYLRLGLPNLFQVAWYRIRLRLGVHPVQKLRRDIGGQEFFSPFLAGDQKPSPPEKWWESALSFGWHEIPLQGKPPRWHFNPFSGVEFPGAKDPWWSLSDFDPTAGDIKAVWEASRFDWVLALAQRGAAGDSRALSRLNEWLADWCRNNPCYLGCNWKCGQEASLRVLHLALAVHLLGQDKSPAADLVRLLEAHLVRIRATMSYAEAQDNNHGITEAAALFVGGSLCGAAGVAEAETWAQEGRRSLEKSVRRLISPDGTFSQYSLNYHRLMLDTLSFVELWRQWHELPSFSLQWQAKARAATIWLHGLINAQSGSGPNLGANDGANLLPLTSAPTGDFRPSVQLAMALFDQTLAYVAEGQHQVHLKWLEVSHPAKESAPPVSRNFSNGGYAVLRQEDWLALLRYPRYRFRPHHCDGLHLDLWAGSLNLFRDAGSFSYHAEPRLLDYFPGAAGHNTVAFDDHEQMPRLSRFLYASWLKTRSLSFGAEDDQGGEAAAEIRDWRGCLHARKVRVGSDRILIEDRVDGFAQQAVLRWRLAPGDWTLSGEKISGLGFGLEISANVEITRIELNTGWESLHYLQKSPLPVLEVEVRTPGIIKTRVIKLS